MALQRIDWQYKREKKMSEANLVLNLNDGQTYVLKPVDHFVDQRVVTWLSEVWHPGLPRCVGITADDKEKEWFVFEYVHGQTVAQHMSNDVHVSLDEQLNCVIQWAKILTFMHTQGEYPIVHLDIKPRNLVVDEQGNTGIIDFGAACLLDRPKPDQVKTYQAMTPSYAAPELINGEPSAASDVYALGLSLLVWMTGFSPGVCREKPLRDLLPNRTDGLPRVISRCLHSKEDQRYKSAQELLQDVQKVRSQKADGLNIVSKAQSNTSKDDQDSSNSSPGERVPQGAKSTMICVWGEPACGCELAAVLAHDHSVLVIDANLLNPRGDLLLGQARAIYHGWQDKQSSGLESALQAEQEGRLTPRLIESLAVKTRVDNVNLLACCSSLDVYEYSRLDSFHQLLTQARFTADRLIVLCHRSVFDAYTCLSLVSAEKILLPVRGDIASFREVNRAVDFMSARYPFEKDRLFYAAYLYDPKENLSWGTMDELSGGRLTTCISTRRRRSRTAGQSRPYAAGMTKTNEHEYMRLIRRMKLNMTKVKEGA